jgi:hypothetical protein
MNQIDDPNPELCDSNHNREEPNNEISQTEETLVKRADIVSVESSAKSLEIESILRLPEYNQNESKFLSVLEEKHDTTLGEPHSTNEETPYGPFLPEFDNTRTRNGPATALVAASIVSADEKLVDSSLTAHRREERTVGPSNPDPKQSQPPEHKVGDGEMAAPLELADALIEGTVQDGPTLKRTITFEERCEQLGLSRVEGLEHLRAENFWGTESTATPQTETLSHAADSKSRTIANSICDYAAGVEKLSQTFVDQINHKGRLLMSVDRAEPSLSDEEKRAIIGFSVRRKVECEDDRFQTSEKDATNATVGDLRTAWAEEFDRREKLRAWREEYFGEGERREVALLAAMDRQAKQKSHARLPDNPFYLPPTQLRHSPRDEDETELAQHDDTTVQGPQSERRRTTGGKRTRTKAPKYRRPPSDSWAVADNQRKQEATNLIHYERLTSRPVPDYPQHERYARWETAQREPMRDRSRLSAPVLSVVAHTLNSSLGSSWSSERCQFNLLSEYQLLKYGLSVHKVAGGELYLSDQDGMKYPIRVSGTQFMIRVHHREALVDRGGSDPGIDFIIDSGAFGHIMRLDDANKLRGGGGTQCVSVGSFAPGSRDDLFGGDAWYACFKDEHGEWRAPKTRVTAVENKFNVPSPEESGATRIPEEDLNAFIVDVREKIVLPVRRHSSRVPTETKAERFLRLGSIAYDAWDKEENRRAAPEVETDEIDSQLSGEERDILHDRGVDEESAHVPEEDPKTTPAETDVAGSQYLDTDSLAIEEGLGVLKRRRRKRKKKHSADSNDRYQASKAVSMMETMGASLTKYNEAVTRGALKGVVPLASASDIAGMENDMAGSKLAARASSKQADKKIRIAQEPFSIVFVDGYEGASGSAEASHSRHQYILRFVCGATGYQKSFSCLQKDAFVDAFRMFLAWVRAVAPIIEQKRSLPTGHIAVRVLASDRDSNFTTITGATRTQFDEEALSNQVLRYFADKGDSATCGAVESTFGPSARAVAQALLRSGMPHRFSLYAWMDAEDKFNVLPSTANRLGGGAPPSETCGFATDVSRFQRFGCVGNLNVSHKNLVANQDGTVSVAKGSKEESDSRVKRHGKLGIVKSLPCFYLRSGGGLTTNAFSGQEFGGWLVYCPALDNDRFKGGGIHASRNVTWHPRLRPKRMWPNGFTSDPTAASAVVVPDGTDKTLPLDMLRKMVDVDPSVVQQVKNGLDAQSHAESEEIVFERFEVDPVLVDNNRPKTDEAEPVPPTDDDDCGSESDESMIAAIELHENSQVPITNVGDSLCGQRMLEQHPYGAKREATHGLLAGKRVARMPMKEASKVVGRALRDSKIKFVWDPTHEKSDASGIRYKSYSRRVHSVEDYDRVKRERIPGINKNTIVRGDLVHDVSIGALTFQHCLSVKPLNHSPDVGRYIHGKDAGVVHEILTVQPKLDCTQDDVMFDIWQSSKDTKISVPHLQMLSKSVFRVCRHSPSGPPTYEVKTLREALMSEHWETHWKPACIKELEGLERRGVWETIHRSQVPKGASIIPSRLVFKIKVDADNVFDKCKARLVFRGDRAVHERDYFDTSSHMMSSMSLKILLSLSTGEWGNAVEQAINNGATREEALELCECFKVHTVDISQAYVVADWPVGAPALFMELPSLDPSRARNMYCAAMRRMLYGIPSSGRVWEKHLDAFLRKDCNARPMVGDRSVYKMLFYRGSDGSLRKTPETKGDRSVASVMCGTFVDDIGFWGTTDEAVSMFRNEFYNKFGKDGVTGGGVASTMLGMKISYDDEELSSLMSMPGYIDAIVARFEKFPDMSCPLTPLPTNHEDVKFEGALDLDRKRLFQQMIGSLTWASHQARPETMIASSILASHCMNPGEEHIQLAMHAIRYLRGTRDRGIKFHGRSSVLDTPYPRRHKLDSMVDANLGGDAFSEHSRSCYVIMLNGGVISMKIMKQTTIARSTGHAEMQALVLLTQQLQACRDLMAELGYLGGSTRILEDNSACVMQAGGDHQAAKSAHYRRDQAAVDEAVNAGKIFVDKVPSKLNCSDLGTKAVKPVELFQFLRDRMTGYDTDTYVSPTVQKALDGVLYVTPLREVLILRASVGCELVKLGTGVTKKGAAKPVPEDTSAPHKSPLQTTEE